MIVCCFKRGRNKSELAFSALSQAPLFMPNLSLRKKKNLSSFRTIALGTWRTAYDPSTYGSMSLNMNKAIDYRNRLREASGKRVTVTHMMAKAVGAMFEAMPDANAIMRYGRIYERNKIGVFFQVALKNPDTGQIDLSGVTIRDPEQKTLLEITDEFEERANKVRGGQDKELEKTRSTFSRIPVLLSRTLINVMGFISYTLNISLPGMSDDAFGSAMVSNVGTLGLEEAYPPLVPYSRVPLVMALGEVKDAPLVEEGELVVGKVLKVMATFDHRILDGSHAAKMSATLKEWFENPEKYFGKIEDVVDSSTN